MNIWLLLKHKTSLNSYETNRLKDEGNVEVILHKNVDVIIDRDDRKSIRVKNKVLDLPDVILPRTGSGTGYFGTSVIRHFESLNIPVVNSSECINTVKDKLYFHQMMQKGGMPTPKTMFVKNPVNCKLVEKTVGFPCVVKVLTGSYGKGVYLSSSRSNFKDLMEMIHNIKTDEGILVQEYIKSNPGEDLRVIVVGGKVLGAMKRSSKDGSFKANISRGGKAENYKLNETIEELAINTCALLNLEVGGVDILFDGSGYKLCEANSAPGFKEFKKTTEINVAKAIIDYSKSKVS